MARQLGIGIAGAGVIGALHAGALEGIDGTRLLAIAEPREEAGKELAGKHGARWYATFDELVAQPDIDLVILATPSGMHPDLAAQAAKAGKHVITEKPMAISREGATRMIDAAKANGITLAVIFQNRLQPDVIKLKRAVERGALGKLILGNAFVHWHRTDEYYAANGGWRGTWALDGGGALMNQSIHTIDLLQWIAGSVASIQAQTATLTHTIEAEDTASAAIRFQNDALGVIQGTTSAAKDFPVRVELIGQEGRAVLTGGTLTDYSGTIELSDDLLTGTDRRLLDGWKPDEGFGAGHHRQLREIVRAIQEGDVAPVPGEEARKAVDIILGIYESARTGARITLGNT